MQKLGDTARCFNFA